MCKKKYLKRKFSSDIFCVFWKVGDLQLVKTSFVGFNFTTGTQDDQLFDQLSKKEGFFLESASLVASFLPLWCSAEIPKLQVYVVGL